MVSGLCAEYTAGGCKTALAATEIKTTEKTGGGGELKSKLR